MSDRDKAFGYAISSWGTSDTPARENLAFADGWKAALDWIERRQAARATAEQSVPNAWISVDERLPEPGEAVLIAFADGGVDLSFRYVMKKTGAHVCWEDVSEEHHEPPTHWQPLPKPPTDAAIESQRSGDGS